MFGLGATELLVLVVAVLIVAIGVRAIASGFATKTAQVREKPCPYCGEYIKTVAIVCRFCQKDLRHVG